MYVLNLAIHHFHNNVHKYVWDETIASKGSQEIVSCILEHLKNRRSQKHIIAFSDMYARQNRNIKVAITSPINMYIITYYEKDFNISIITHYCENDLNTSLINCIGYSWLTSSKITNIIKWIKLCLLF